MKLSIELSNNETEKIINVVKEHIPELSKGLISYGINRYIRTTFDIAGDKVTNRTLERTNKTQHEIITDLKGEIKLLKQKRKVKK